MAASNDREESMQLRMNNSRNTADVDHQGGTEPATSVVYFNEQHQSETSSSDSEIVALPAFKHIVYAVTEHRYKMFEFLQTLTPGKIARSVLAGGLILGSIVYLHRIYERIFREKEIQQTWTIRVGPSQPPPSYTSTNSTYKKHPHPTHKLKPCLPSNILGMAY
ncbi:hypothetical protein J6590_097695 [Homalodisca vitripennis]|nr:hypothetical protein J6590_097695 [Homalodisca vitripennis]